MKKLKLFYLPHYTTELTSYEAIKIVNPVWAELAPLFIGADGVLATVTHTKFPLSIDEFGAYKADRKGWEAYRDMTIAKFRHYDGPFFRGVSVLLKDMYECDLMVSKFVLNQGNPYHITFFAFNVNPSRPYMLAYDDDEWLVPEVDDLIKEIPERLKVWFDHYKERPAGITSEKVSIERADRETIKQLWESAQIQAPTERWDGTRQVERDPLGLDKETPGFFGINYVVAFLRTIGRFLFK